MNATDATALGDSTVSDEPTLRFLLPSSDAEGLDDPVIWSCPERLTRDWNTLRNLSNDFGGSLTDQIVPLPGRDCADPLVFDRLAQYALADQSGLFGSAESGVKIGNLVRDDEWAFFGDVRSLGLDDRRDYVAKTTKLCALATFVDYARLVDACVRVLAACVEESESAICERAPDAPSVLRYIFDLPDDFTEEERVQVRQDAEWLRDNYSGLCAGGTIPSREHTTK